MFDLSGKVAVVTGGGADGIGGAIARLFAEHGALVEIADIDRERAERNEAAIASAGREVRAHVVDVTSADRLYRAWQRTLRQGVRTATPPSIPGALRTVFGARAPVVTVHDAASHTLSWLGSALGVPAVSLGVDTFGQSGTVSDLYRVHDLDAGSIVNAALAALSLDQR